MFINIERYVDFLIEHSMTPNQFLFCYLVHLDRYDLVHKYVVGFRAWNVKELDLLEEKDYIINWNREGDSSMYNYLVTDKFSSAILVDEEAGIMLWEFYPSFINVEGKRLPAKSCNKENLIADYLKRIGYDKIKHRFVMDQLRYAKEHGMLTMGIKKWVESQQWEQIDDLRNEEKDGHHGIDIR